MNYVAECGRCWPQLHNHGRGSVFFGSLRSCGVWPKMKPKDDQTESIWQDWKTWSHHLFRFAKKTFFENEISPHNLYLHLKIWAPNVQFHIIPLHFLGFQPNEPTPCWFKTTPIWKPPGSSIGQRWKRPRRAKNGPAASAARWIGKYNIYI